MSGEIKGSYPWGMPRFSVKQLEAIDELAKGKSAVLVWHGDDVQLAEFINEIISDSRVGKRSEKQAFEILCAIFRRPNGDVYKAKNIQQGLANTAYRSIHPKVRR